MWRLAFRTASKLLSDTISHRMRESSRCLMCIFADMFGKKEGKGVGGEVGCINREESSQGNYSISVQQRRTYICNM